MGTPFIGEIRLVSFNFPPKGWAFCNGQLLPINQNQALFSILGTTYGGDGRVTFALPNLQGRVPVHMGPGYVLGQTGGEQAHTLIQSELPTHTHTVPASNLPARTTNPNGATWAAASGQTAFAGAPTGVMKAQASTATGGSQPHNNMQPYLTLNFVIALQGVFPSPS